MPRRAMRGRATVTTCALAFVAGCYSFPQNNGYYLTEGTSGDVGVYLEEVRIFLPVPGGPTYLDTNQFVGGLYLFASGDVFPAKHFTFPQSAYALDGSFSVTAPSDSDPSETVQLSGKCVDTNGDGSPDDITGTVVLPDGSQALTIARSSPSDFDHYKCWDGPGTCKTAVGPPACDFTDLGDGSYSLSAEFDYKAGDGDLSGGGASIMEIASSAGGSENTTCPFGPLPGPGVCDWGTGEFAYTTTLTGVTEGTVTYSVPKAIFLPDAKWNHVGLEIANAAPSTQTAGARCLLPWAAGA